MKKEKKYIISLAVMALLVSGGFVLAEDGSMNPPPLGVQGDMKADIKVRGEMPPRPRDGMVKDIRGDVRDIRKENADLRGENKEIRADFREDMKGKSPEDRKEARDEMKEKIKDNREEMKDNRDEIKEKREELRNELHLKMQVRFTAMVERLSKLADRIQSRIDEMKASGSDTTKAQADLDIAKTSLAELKVKADAAVIVQGDDQATKDANKAKIDEIKKLSKKVKDALMLATYDLKPAKN